MLTGRTGLGELPDSALLSKGKSVRLLDSSVVSGKGPDALSGSQSFAVLVNGIELSSISRVAPSVIGVSSSGTSPSVLRRRKQEKKSESYCYSC